MKSNILIFQQIVPAYRVPVFRSMYRKFGSILCHSTHNRSSHIASATQSIDFPHEIVKNYDLAGTWQMVLPALRKYNPKIIIAGVAVTNLTFFKLLLLKFIFRYKLIAWGHGVNNKELNNPLQGVRGRIMKFYFKKADAVIFYSERRKEIVEQLLPSLKGKCFIAWNTLDLSIVKNIYAELQQKGQQAVRRELGKNFSAQYNLIFIGRLLTDKRIDLLLQVVEILVPQLSIALHIIGDGQEEDLIKQHSLFDKCIFHYGAIYNDAITGKYLYASDLFVMPGYIGLSIIHAFACGLPVLTCKTGANGPFHSPEIEYLQPGRNGILSAGDPLQMAADIKDLLEDAAKLQEMKKNAEKKAYEECTIERMMHGFERAIDFVSSQPA